MSEQGRIEFEQAVLRLIAEGKGEWRWHNIAFALSRMGMMTEHDLMQVFKDLLSVPGAAPLRRGWRTFRGPLEALAGWDSTLTSGRAP